MRRRWEHIKREGGSGPFLFASIFYNVLACFLICVLVLLAITLFLFVLILLHTDFADRFYILFFLVVIVALRCDDPS